MQHKLETMRGVRTSTTLIDSIVREPISESSVVPDHPTSLLTVCLPLPVFQITLVPVD